MPQPRLQIVHFAIICCLFSARVEAFDPPVDTVGSLTVRIEGPEIVRLPETAMPVRVVLENQGDRPIEGVVELQLIDHWRAEPTGAVQFTVAGKSKIIREFQVVAGNGTYNAHYPIHVFARFNLDGVRQTAHPILIVKTQFPLTPHTAVSPEWKPVHVPAVSKMALWRLPVRRVVIQVFGQPPVTMPVNWQGVQSDTGAVFEYVPSHVSDGQMHDALAIQPPYEANKVGTMLIEFPLTLPKSKSLRLRFSNALMPGGKGDGVTYRVRMLPFDAPEGQQGKVVFEKHTATQTWCDAEADLSEYAGQNVRLQMESHPGPKNNPDYDFSFWGEPTLVSGMPTEPPFPTQDNSGSRVLGTINRSGLSYEIRVWPGQRGLLDTVIGFQRGSVRLCFRGFEVTADDCRLDDPCSPAKLLKITEEPRDHGLRIRHRFLSASGNFDLLGDLWIERGVLRVKFQLDREPAPQPWHVVRLQDLAVGPWSETIRAVYAGDGNVVRRPEAMRLAYNGHQLSTSFVGFDFEPGLSLVQAVDFPPDSLNVIPSYRHYSLHASGAPMMTLIPAENVWDAANIWREVNGLSAAPGVRQLAGRFTFDFWFWETQYSKARDDLQRAFRYGLTNSVVVWHNWQRWGYDYRLPDIYPPNPKYGSTADFRAIGKLCKDAGVLFAPHNNWLCLYPDAEGFSYEKMVAFNADRTPMKAWFNNMRNAQSYRSRVDVMEAVLRHNAQLIRDGLQPNACYIDELSAIAPYDSWTADGKFVDRIETRNTWGRQLAWTRQFLGDNAPAISECGHDALIGYLDGAQSVHLRVRKPVPEDPGIWTWDWKCGDAERIPWFDAAYHDRLILSGAGYPDRYQGGLAPRDHGIYSDDYLSTEVLTGHPAMVSWTFNRDVVRKYWLTNALMQALAMQHIVGVDFDGGLNGNVHRQHIRWSGGGEVWVNRGNSDWTVPGHTLPQYGFVARAPTEKGVVEASLTRRDGAIAETASSERQLYVNARQKTVDFGPVTTTGGCQLTWEGKSITVIPLPDSGKEKTVLRIRPTALGWQLSDATQIEVIAEDGTILDRLPIRYDGDAMTIECATGVFAYRIVFQKARR